ncbi:hypothetical protein VaNZ11_009094, partial [Volvox africanus]
MTDYFNFEVFVHALEFADPAFVEATLGLPDSTQFPVVPYAVAFSFLDYPLILVYAKHGALETSSFSETFPTYYDFISFDSGKSCMLQADAEEMLFLINQTPLYLSLFHVKTLPKPTMLAAGHTPLLISRAPAADSRSAWDEAPPVSNPATALGNSVIRQVTLFSPAGVEVGTLHMSCRLTHYGPRVPPLSTLTMVPSSSSTAIGKNTSLHTTSTATAVSGSGRNKAFQIPLGGSSSPTGAIKEDSTTAGNNAAATMSDLQHHRRTMVARAAQPPQPPALFFANDPLMAQQPQAFLQQAQAQVARHRAAFSRGDDTAVAPSVTAMAAPPHHSRFRGDHKQQQQQQQPVYLTAGERGRPPVGVVMARQAHNDSRQADEKYELYGASTEEEEEEESGEEEALEVEGRRRLTGKVQSVHVQQLPRRRRRWDDDGPRPRQAIIEALYNGRGTAFTASQEDLVTLADEVYRETYRRLRSEREKLASGGGGGGGSGSARGRSTQPSLKRPATAPSPGESKSPAAAGAAASQPPEAAVKARPVPMKSPPQTASASKLTSKEAAAAQLARQPGAAWAAPGDRPPAHNRATGPASRGRGRPTGTSSTGHRSPSPQRNKETPRRSGGGGGGGGGSPGRRVTPYLSRRRPSWTVSAAPATAATRPSSTPRQTSSQRRRTASPPKRGQEHLKTKKQTNETVSRRSLHKQQQQQLAYSGRKPSPRKRKGPSPSRARQKVNQIDAGTSMEDEYCTAAAEAVATAVGFPAQDQPFWRRDAAAGGDGASGVGLDGAIPNTFITGGVAMSDTGAHKESDSGLAGGAGGGGGGGTGGLRQLQLPARKHGPELQ